MEKVNKEFWKIFANKNFRGLPVADLYCELQPVDVHRKYLILAPDIEEKL